MAYETIIVDIQDHISVVTLNRPDALNALNDQLLEELGDALVEAQKNDKVRCIVLTGSEKAFAAGADIRMMSSKSFVEAFGEDLFTYIHSQTDYRGCLRLCPWGGCELAMICDFIICSDTAKFEQPEINLGYRPGLVARSGSHDLLANPEAMDMNLTGRFMEAEEAERCGL